LKNLPLREIYTCCFAGIPLILKINLFFIKIKKIKMFSLIRRPSLAELCESMVHLIYPELCVACNRELPAADTCFCLPCSLKLIPFQMDCPSDNAFTNRFWGRIPVEWGVAAYHFSRKSPVQKALHQLKYRNNPDVGVKMGRHIAVKLKYNSLVPQFDMIIPVPLHQTRERLRGYNQSAMFARGISEIMDVPVRTDCLKRVVATSTQTRRKRMERFSNVAEVFAVLKPEPLRGKRILLVDDVLTTGATLELCAAALSQVEGVRMGMATIAIADK
jgi:ComF family protein